MKANYHFIRHGKNSTWSHLGKVLLFVLLMFNGLTAQKVVKKSVVNSAITLISIDAGNCFQISMNTSNINEIIVEATIDGEYKNYALWKRSRCQT